MKATQTKDKRLKKVITMFVISIILIAIGVLILALNIKKGSDDFSPIFILGPMGLSVGYILFMISCFVNRSYRQDCYHPGAFSTFIYVLTWIFVYPPCFVVVIAMLFMGVGGFSSEAEKLKTVTIIDEKGRVYTLKQTYAGSIEFKDQDGSLWKTYDNGATYELVEAGAYVDIEAKDENGNEKTMKRTYSDFMTDHYQDQDGEEYKSYDKGKTFEHVVTHATVKDKDGNEYSLRASFSGSGRFVDQNGDEWMTYDEGKTFERIEKK